MQPLSHLLSSSVVHCVRVMKSEVGNTMVVGKYQLEFNLNCCSLISSYPRKKFRPNVLKLRQGTPQNISPVLFRHPSRSSVVQQYLRSTSMELSPPIDQIRGSLRASCRYTPTRSAVSSIAVEPIPSLSNALRTMYP